MSVVTLADRPHAALAGGKFAGLAAAAAHADVPPAVCLTVEAFAEALGPQRLRRLEAVVADVRATVGAFVVEAQAEVADAVAGVALSAEQRRALVAAVREACGPLEGQAFAVRSSAADEDREEGSRAGVYASVLGVEGEDGIADAVAACWRSFYAPAALAARVRAGDFDAAPRMAVVVQRMVEPERAGVAFSDGDVVHVESVAGRGDALVAGAGVPERATLRGGDVGGAAPPHLRETVLRLRAASGADVDVEWAYAAGRLHVLQCRPVSAALDPSRPAAGGGPYLAAARLYLDETLPDGFALGAVAPVYASYVAKRAAAYRLADRHGVRTGAAHVLSLNGAALRDEGARARLRGLLDASRAPQVVIDAAPTLRQIVVGRREAPERLAALLDLDRAGAERHGCIVRDFITGSHGAISMLHGNGGAVVEVSRDGLLGLNRGTASGARVRVRDAGLPLDRDNVDGDAGEDVLRALPTIVSFTQRLNDALPGTQLEWVVDGGVAVFVDFSRVDAAAGLADAGETVLVSGGVARGPVVRAGDDALLERLSIGPAVSVGRAGDAIEHAALQALVRELAALDEKAILVARRPYAVLSTVFDHVAGFVFEEGAVLSHLGILLREARIPAVIHPSPPDGGEAVIADGALTVAAAEAAL